jgi:hypothetical protein
VPRRDEEFRKVCLCIRDVVQHTHTHVSAIEPVSAENRVFFVCLLYVNRSTRTLFANGKHISP